jgi:hypothetical protein
MFSLPTTAIIEAINSCDVALLTGKSAAPVLAMDRVSRATDAFSASSS